MACGFAVALCGVAASGSASAADAAKVACAGDACGALSFAVENGCLEIRNVEASPVVVTFSVGEGARSERGLVVLRPFGKDRAALIDRCVGGAPDDLDRLSLEAQPAGPVEARPTANCTGEACTDVALSNEKGCLTVRNLGNGYIAFQSGEAHAKTTLVDPHGTAAAIAADGRACVASPASAAGAVTATFRRTSWASDETLIGRCTGEACARLSRRKVDDCVMFTNDAARWVRFKMNFVPGNATGITSALYEVAPGKEVMPLPGNMCLRTLAETPYEASFAETPPGAAPATGQ